jgi:hypothetical protein
MWALVAGLTLSGCLGFRAVRGSGNVGEETRTFSDFTQVQLAAIGNLYIELGEQEQLRIEADDNLLRYFQTEVRDGTLRIEVRDRVTLVPMEPIQLYLTVKELESVVLSGLANIELSDELQLPSLSVTISGGGHVEIEDLVTDVLQVSITGLGDLYIDEGKAAKQAITISGGGDYRARGLESDAADVRISGLGAATVWAKDQLKVDISGGGSVKYLGDPSLEQNISGVGRVVRVGE